MVCSPEVRSESPFLDQLSTPLADRYRIERRLGDNHALCIDERGAPNVQGDGGDVFNGESRPVNGKAHDARRTNSLRRARTCSCGVVRPAAASASAEAIVGEDQSDSNAGDGTHRATTGARIGGGTRAGRRRAERDRRKLSARCGRAGRTRGIRDAASRWQRRTGTSCRTAVRRASPSPCSARPIHARRACR